MSRLTVLCHSQGRQERNIKSNLSDLLLCVNRLLCHSALLSILLQD